MHKTLSAGAPESIREKRAEGGRQRRRQRAIEDAEIKAQRQKDDEKLAAQRTAEDAAVAPPLHTGVMNAKAGGVSALAGGTKSASTPPSASTVLPCGHPSKRRPEAHGPPSGYTHLPIPKADGVKARHDQVPRRMWLFWFGRNLEGERARAFSQIGRAYGKDLNITLVTDKNLPSFQVPGEPFHPAMALLTAVHRSDYLFAYFAHHYGGGMHDIKMPSRQSWIPFFARMDTSQSTWLTGVSEGGLGGIACNEDAAGNDPECQALRASRGETALNFSSVDQEHRTQCVNGTMDPFDAGKGACCQWLVKKEFKSLVNVQNFIVRPRTPITADWLRIVHHHMDYKLTRLRAHPAPAGYPRCCFHHEFGYPFQWAELKGDVLHPLQRQYKLHVASGLPKNEGLSRREDVDKLGRGRLGWIDLRQPMI